MFIPWVESMETVISELLCWTISSVQSLSRVQLFATPWTAACQASLSITNSWSLLKLMSIELVMPSNHLILCHPLLLLPSIFASKGLSSQGYGFSSSHVCMWELDWEESWAPKNWCFWTVVLEKTLESPLDCKEIQPVHPKENQENIQENIHWKDWCWSWNSNTLATLCEELTNYKRPWFWERLKAGRKGDNRGQDDWMASLTQWTWVWASSRRWQRTGKLGVLQSVQL